MTSGCGGHPGVQTFLPPSHLYLATNMMIHSCSRAARNSPLNLCMMCMQRLAWDKGLILNLCRNKLLLVLVKVARSVIVRRQLWRLLHVQDKKCAFNNKMFILPSFCVCMCTYLYIACFQIVLCDNWFVSSFAWSCFPS